MTTPQFCLVLVDLTTSATPDAMRPAQVFQQLIDAELEQIDGPFAVYGLASVAIRIASGPDDRSTSEVACNFRDTLPEAPGALAYHSVTNGVPDIELGVDLFTSLSDGLDSLTGGFSHEVLEMLGDAGANGWKDTGTGVMNAAEACDFVQNTGYKSSNGLWMSNFVLPSFFIPGALGPWDFQGVMQSQADVSSGYGIQCPAPGGVTQIGGLLGEHLHKIGIVGALSELQKKRKSRPYSRTYRRGGRLV